MQEGFASDQICDRRKQRRRDEAGQQHGGSVQVLTFRIGVIIAYCPVEIGKMHKAKHRHQHHFQREHRSGHIQYPGGTIRQKGQHGQHRSRKQQQEYPPPEWLVHGQYGQIAIEQRIYGKIAEQINRIHYPIFPILRHKEPCMA